MFCKGKWHFCVFWCFLNFAGLVHVSPLFLSVKARTAQLAKIKWFISVAFYILQVSVRCRPGSGQLFVSSACLCMCVVFFLLLMHMCVMCTEAGGGCWVSSLTALLSILRNEADSLTVFISWALKCRQDAFLSCICVGAGDRNCTASSLLAEPFVNFWERNNSISVGDPGP